MTQEALKLAIEALYPIAHNTTDDPRGQAYKAITALKEVLAQTQDRQCKRCTDGCPACDARKLQKEAHDLL